MKKSRNGERAAVYATPVRVRKSENSFAVFQSPVSYTPSKELDESDMEAICRRIKELESELDHIAISQTPIKTSSITNSSTPARVTTPEHVVKYIPQTITWEKEEEEYESYASFFATSQPETRTFFITPSKQFDPVKLGRSTAIQGTTCNSSLSRWVRVEEGGVEQEDSPSMQILQNKITELQSKISVLESKMNSGSFTSNNTNHMNTNNNAPSMASIMANRPPNPFAAARPAIDLSFKRPLKNASDRLVEQKPVQSSSGGINLSDIVGIKQKKVDRDAVQKPPLAAPGGGGLGGIISQDVQRNTKLKSAVERDIQKPKKDLPPGGVGFGGIVSLDVQRNTRLKSAADRVLKSPPKETRPRVIGNQFMPTLGEITGLKLRTASTDILRSPGGTPFRKIASPQKFSSPRSMLRAKLTPVSNTLVKTPSKTPLSKYTPNKSKGTDEGTQKNLFLVASATVEQTPDTPVTLEALPEVNTQTQEVQGKDFTFT